MTGRLLPRVKTPRRKENGVVTLAPWRASIQFVTVMQGNRAGPASGRKEEKFKPQKQVRLSYAGRSLPPGRYARGHSGYGWQCA